MYLHIGQETLVPETEIIGIFDLDNTTYSAHTRAFLKYAEQAGEVIAVSEELPKSFVLCAKRQGQTVYVSQLNPQTLAHRQFSDSTF